MQGSNQKCYVRPPKSKMICVLMCYSRTVVDSATSREFAQVEVPPGLPLVHRLLDEP